MFNPDVWPIVVTSHKDGSVESLHSGDHGRTLSFSRAVLPFIGRWNGRSRSRLLDDCGTPMTSEIFKHVFIRQCLTTHCTPLFRHRWVLYQWRDRFKRSKKNMRYCRSTPTLGGSSHIITKREEGGWCDTEMSGMFTPKEVLISLLWVLEPTFDRSHPNVGS